MINTNLTEAPKDRNILILTTVMHYHNYEWDRHYPRQHRRESGWYSGGQRWVEARWRDAHGGRPAQFAEWCGNPRTQSTGTLYPIAWAELPQ